MAVYPYTIARSTRSDSDALLASILAAGSLDELSNAEDFSAVEGYIRNTGRVDSSSKTTIGLLFWVYPTGLHGPYHETQEAEIEQHGTLVTVESGASSTDALAKIKRGFNLSGIGHVHVAKS